MVKCKKAEMGNVPMLSKCLLIILFFNLVTVVVNGQKLKEFIADKKEFFSSKFEFIEIVSVIIRLASFSASFTFNTCV